MQLYRKTDIMKNYFLLLVLFLTCNCLFSQSKKHIAEYQSNAIHVALLNNQGKELTKVLFGKDVSVTIDDFYNLLEIKFENREGGVDTMKLYSIGIDESVVGNTYLIMKDVLDNTYHVHGDLEKLGTLVIFFNKNSKSGNKTYLTIQGATRVHSNRTNESDIAFSTGSLN